MSDTATDAGPELVELVCDFDNCGETITGPATGAGSAKFKLASHRYRVHGIRADGTVRPPKAKTPKRSSTSDSTARPVMEVVRGIRDEMTTGSGPPSEDQLTRAGAHALGIASTAFASYMAETEDGLSDAERDKITDELSLSNAEAREIVRPLAHLVQPTKVNKNYGRTAVENVDAFAAVLELGSYMLRVRRYFRQRAQRSPNVIELQPLAVVPEGPQGPPPGPGATPGEVVLTSGVPSTGTVVDANMVQRLRSHG
jgi:hypothetical protein